MTVRHVGTHIEGSSVAVWMRGEDGKEYLVVYEDFCGEIDVNFNVGQKTILGHFIDSERLPGGQISIRGSYRRANTVKKTGLTAIEVPHSVGDSRK